MVKGDESACLSFAAYCLVKTATFSPLDRRIGMMIEPQIASLVPLAQAQQWLATIIPSCWLE